MSKINYDLSQIKAFVFDVDGVLSPSLVPCLSTGEPMRMANVKDSYAIQLALKHNYIIAVITGCDSESVRLRFENFGTPYIYMCAQFKTEAYADFLNKTGLDASEVLYMGDDIPDYEVMLQCGLATCPEDAVPEIKAVSAYISPYSGGQGCVRDVIEQVLRAQGDWMSEQAFGW